LAIAIVFLLGLGLGKAFSSDPSPIAHPGVILLNWAQIHKDFEAARRIASVDGIPIVADTTLDAEFVSKVKGILGGYQNYTIKISNPRVFAIEFDLERPQIPLEAEEIRYHSSSIVALSSAIAYSSVRRPDTLEQVGPQLAVGTAMTKPQGGRSKVASPGLYYSADLLGSLYYAYGGPYQIGAVMILQAPIGKICSSESNKVTYRPEQHVIRGAILSKCFAVPETRLIKSEELHPLGSKANRCLTTETYRHYCLLVGGFGPNGRYQGDHWRVANVGVGHEPWSRSTWLRVHDVMRRADEADRESRNLRPDQWPSPLERENRQSRHHYC
jgi:hypothetical protein